MQKTDNDILTSDAIKALENCEAPARGGEKSNLFILVINNVMNDLKFTIWTQENPNKSSAMSIEPVKIIASDRLCPPQAGKMRLMTEAVLNEAKRIRKALNGCVCYWEGDTPTISIGEFKQIFRDADALLSPETEMGKFYKEAISKALSVIESWQQGRLWSAQDKDSLKSPAAQRPSRP